MPVMIRPRNKAKKIAYKIMGVPINMQEKPTPREREVEARLTFDDTIKVR